MDWFLHIWDLPMRCRTFLCMTLFLCLVLQLGPIALITIVIGYRFLMPLWTLYTLLFCTVQFLVHNFQKGLGEIGELEIHERGIQFLGSNTRRVNEYVWVRVNELIFAKLYPSWCCVCS